MQKINFLILAIVMALSGLAQAQSDQNCTASLIDTQLARQKKAELLRSANASISMSYFSFTEDTTTFELLVLLKEARDRGVQVKAIFDPWSGKISPNILKYFEEIGVESQYYNPVNLGNITRATRRDHDKYTIVDGKAIIMGGRNLGSEYYDESNPTNKHFFVDMDLIMRGTLAQTAQTYFENRWQSTWMSPTRIGKSFDGDEYQNFKKNMQAFRVQYLKDHPYPYAEQISSEQRLAIGQAILNRLVPRECTETEFHHLDPYTHRRDRSLEKRYVDLINKSRDGILIINPYVVLTRPLMKAMLDARARRVEITIFTNSTNSNDIPWAQAAYLNDRQKLLNAGIEIYEFYDKSNTIHGKIAIFDQKTSLIGSFNLDPISSIYNSEVVAISQDPEIINHEIEFYNSVAEKVIRILPDGGLDQSERKVKPKKMKKLNRIAVKLFRNRV